MDHQTDKTGLIFVYNQILQESALEKACQNPLIQAGTPQITKTF